MDQTKLVKDVAWLLANPDKDLTAEYHDAGNCCQDLDIPKDFLNYFRRLQFQQTLLTYKDDNRIAGFLSIERLLHGSAHLILRFFDPVTVITEVIINWPMIGEDKKATVRDPHRAEGNRSIKKLAAFLRGGFSSEVQFIRDNPNICRCGYEKRLGEKPGGSWRS